MPAIYAARQESAKEEGARPLVQKLNSFPHPSALSALVGFGRPRYSTAVSLLLRQIARFAARRIASDPRVRAKAAEAARHAVEEVKQIAREEDRPRAAGRAVRRALRKLQGDR